MDVFAHTFSNRKMTRTFTRCCCSTLTTTKVCSLLHCQSSSLPLQSWCALTMSSWRQSGRWWKEKGRVSVAFIFNLEKFILKHFLALLFTRLKNKQILFITLAFRLGKTISNCDYALLMPDYCTIPKCISALVGATGQTLSIEIKVCLPTNKLFCAFY